MASGYGNTPATDPTAAGAKKTPKKKAEVVDSWEDEEVSSDDGGDAEPAPPAGAVAPPPRPLSPQDLGARDAHDLATSRPAGASGAISGGGMAPRRPEKTDVVARRMIAGALGIRPPKMTPEQRAYEKAQREAERKRREAERAAQKQKEEEAEKARKAVWED